MIQTLIKVLTLGFFVSTLTGFVIYRMGYFDSAAPSNAMQTSPNGGELNSANQVQDSTQILDSIQSPQINQPNNNVIMPSSKSIAPAFDLEVYEEKKEKELRMSSSKSSTHLFDLYELSIDAEDVKEHYVKPPKSKKEVDVNKFEQLSDEQLRMYSSKSMTHIIKFESLEDLIPEKYRRELFRVDTEISPADVKTIIGPQEIKQPTTSIIASSSKSMHHAIEIQQNQIESKDISKTEIEKPKRTYWGMIGLGVLGILFVGIGSIVYFKRKSR